MAKTRFTDETGIEYEKVLPGDWRHVDTSDGRRAHVGPIYKTKAELLADHEDYLQRAGWLKDKKPLKTWIEVYQDNIQVYSAPYSHIAINHMIDSIQATVAIRKAFSGSLPDNDQIWEAIKTLKNAFSLDKSKKGVGHE